MADYKTMYHVLFAATEDVLALLEKYMASAEELAVPMRIQAILENAQQKCAPLVHKLFTNLVKESQKFLLTNARNVLYYSQGQRKAKSDRPNRNRKEVKGLGTSDMIARFIQAELEEANGVLELQRSDLAQRFGCVPSQINYVMSTRFSPEHGYIVESRRGGGGYIRITRVQVDRHTLLMHVINSVGDTLDLASARAILSNLVQSQAVERNVAQTLLWAVSDNSLRSVPKDRRDDLRASIFKQVLIHLV